AGRLHELLAPARADHHLGGARVVPARPRRHRVSGRPLVLLRDVARLDDAVRRRLLLRRRADARARCARRVRVANVSRGQAPAAMVRGWRHVRSRRSMSASPRLLALYGAGQRRPLYSRAPSLYFGAPSALRGLARRLAGGLGGRRDELLARYRDRLRALPSA